MERRLTAILAADVVGYSRLMGVDEVGTLSRLKSLRAELVQPKIAGRKGRVVKVMGDGLLAEFPSVVEAVQCAEEILGALENREAELPETDRIRLRIGINLGDVIVEGTDIYGDGVNVAARLEGLAEPGGLCISGQVFDAVDGKLDLAFEDLGQQQVKNIAKPVRAYRLATKGLRQKAPTRTDDPLPQPEKPSIVVLPFTNMSGDPEQEFFSDGIAEDITTDLSKVSSLFIISRTSAFAYKGKTQKIQQISEELGVRYVLAGSVRKAGNRVRITAQLIDGRSGGHLWADRFDRDLSDVFLIQNEISQNIVEAAKVAIAPQERAAIRKVPTTNMEAYQYYLRGRQFLHEMTRKNLELARQMFLKAIEIDSDYAHAYAGLSDCGSVLCLFYDDNPKTLEETLAHSRKALHLDPTLAEAHVSHGMVLMLMGEDAAARSELETAIDLDPMLYEAYWFMGRLYMNQGDFGHAAEMFQRASEVRGDDLQSMMMITTCYDGLGDQVQAKASAERAFGIAERRLHNNPDDARAAYVGASSLVFLGDRARALEWANLAAAIESEDSRTNYNLACVYARLGATERAFELLELCIRGGRSLKCLTWVKLDPDLANLRAEPRFGEILQEWTKQDSK